MTAITDHAGIASSDAPGPGATRTVDAFLPALGFVRAPRR